MAQDNCEHTFAGISRSMTLLKDRIPKKPNFDDSKGYIRCRSVDRKTILDGIDSLLKPVRRPANPNPSPQIDVCYESDADDEYLEEEVTEEVKKKKSKRKRKQDAEENEYEAAAAAAAAQEVYEEEVNREQYDFMVPARRISKWDENLCQWVLPRVLKLRSTHGVRKVLAMRTLYVLEHIQRHLFDKACINARSIVYQKGELFKHKDSLCFRIIDDICALLQCDRASLNVFADPEGRVRGLISFTDGHMSKDGTRTDGSYSHEIPKNMSLVSNLASTAQFIFYIEKEEIFQILCCCTCKECDKDFIQHLNCILVTGQPSVATRAFLRTLVDKFNLPIIGLVDCNSYGMRILSTLAYGSKQLAMYSDALVVPVFWLGVRPKDVLNEENPNPNVEEMTRRAAKDCRDLLKMEFMTMDKMKSWREELELMEREMKACQIEGIMPQCSDDHLMKYIIDKFKEEGWISEKWVEEVEEG